MPASHGDTINNDLLAFIRSCSHGSAVRDAPRVTVMAAEPDPEVMPVMVVSAIGDNDRKRRRAADLQRPRAGYRNAAWNSVFGIRERKVPVMQSRAALFAPIPRTRTASWYQ
jgi:hypothetical protein